MRPVDIIRAPQAGGVARPPAGSVLLVMLPGQWLLYVAPNHPAYSDLIGAFLCELSLEALAEFIAEPDCPEAARMNAELVLARRKKEIN